MFTLIGNLSKELFDYTKINKKNFSPFVMLLNGI